MLFSILVNPLKKNIEEYSSFSEITRFRLLNLFVVTTSINILSPLVLKLRGELLTPTTISIIMIIFTLAVKTNKYIIKQNMSNVFKTSVFFHVTFVLSSILYFFNLEYFIFVNILLSIFEIVIFSAYSIQLDVLQAKFFSSELETFKVFRNSKAADCTLIGLSISAILSIISVDYVVYCFFFINFMFSLWLIKNYYFYDKFTNILNRLNR